MRLFAARGFDLVVGVGFIFSSDVDRVARDFPDVHFACIDYAPPPDGPPPNVAGLAFREEEGSFLVGAVAGSLSAHAARRLRRRHADAAHPQVRGGLSRRACSRCARLRRARGLRGDDARRVQGSRQGQGPRHRRDRGRRRRPLPRVRRHRARRLRGRARRGRMAIGVDADQYDEMPDTVVTSMVKRADVAVFDAIRAAVEGRFAGGMHVFGVADGALDYVHEGPHAARLPPWVVARVEALATGSRRARSKSRRPLHPRKRVRRTAGALCQASLNSLPAAAAALTSRCSRRESGPAGPQSAASHAPSRPAAISGARPHRADSVSSAGKGLGSQLPTKRHWPSPLSTHCVRSTTQAL